MAPSQETRDGRRHPSAAGFHHRQIEQISQPKPRGDTARNEQGVARQLNDAISRLDARLSQISNPAARQAQRQDKQRQNEMSSAPASPGLSSLAAAEPGLARFRDRRNRARQSELDAPSQAASAAATAAQRAADRAGQWHPPWLRRQRRQHPGTGFFHPRAASTQDHEPDRGVAASRRIEQSIAGSAANSPRFVTPSPRQCRAGRSNRSRVKSVRWPAASTTTSRAAPTKRHWPGSSARSAKSAKCCAR